MVIQLPYNFTPRHYQCPLFEAVIERKIRRAVAVWHRRAGKDKSFLNILVIMAMETMANYAYYFPTAALGRKALWDNIDARSGMKVIDHIPKELIEKKNEQQMKITLVNGSTIQILGTEALDVVGGNYYGVIFSEAAQHNPLAWDYIRPILRENGGWAIFNGTPRGKNWFHRLATHNAGNPEWYVERLTVDDTGALTAEDVEQERRAGMREEMIRQEYYCDWSVGMPGAIYAQEVDKAREAGRVRAFEPEGGGLVHTAWDLGSPENTAVVYFQRIGPFLYVVDCDIGLRMTTTERVAHMMQKGYNYGFHCLPHDGASTRPGGMSFIQELSGAGLPNVVMIPRTDDPERRINRMWEMFPNIFFNEPKTKSLLEALEGYHRKEDTKQATISSIIVHDWASHPSDAFGYIAEAEMAGIIRENIPGMRDGRRARKVSVSHGVAKSDDADFDDPPESPFRSFRKIRVTTGS